MAKPRLMVTGASGFVAGSVIAQAGKDVEVHAVSRGAALAERDGLHWHTVDLADPVCCRDLFHKIQPDVVIHTAAIADIDYCEAHPEDARRVNAELTAQLAELCKESNTRLVYLSTDTVFDGAKGLYREEDPPGPLNVYAETKVAGEEAVAAMGAGGVVARVSLVMGLPVIGGGNSFLSRMIPKLEAGEELGVPDNEIRSAVDVITLGRALLELTTHDYSGYLHLAGNDALNRFEMVQRIARRLGYDPGLVVANDPTSIPGRAARPLDASMDNAKARSILKTPMRGLEDGLDLVLAYDRGETNDES